MKSLIVCCDGTWQDLARDQLTNVALTARAVATLDGSGNEQIVYYDEGVGTARGVCPWFTQKIGGAFGAGLEDKLITAYRFLCGNYQTGDRIFVFGFSRGAFTARSLCGLIEQVGILRRDYVNAESIAILQYRLKDADPQALADFREGRCVDSRTPITYLGVWDTVGARGLPAGIPGAKRWNARYVFHDISLVKAIASARHAVSIDETRNAFPASLWTDVAQRNKDSNATPGSDAPFQQLWFAGDHGHVGGGAHVDALSNIALLWVLEGARRCGLVVRDAAWESYRGGCDRRPYKIFDAIGAPRKFRNRLLYDLIGYSSRKGIEGWEDLHQSAVDRYDDVVRYRPAALSKLPPRPTLP